ncbi:MAG TPA: hypothetical protein VHM92_12550 [Allosphingosinicella sp.]|nr:hypothetical protein [Allosphingosinicella sp.]
MRPPCETGGSGFAGVLLALVIALAALALGAFIGFLFGLPRTLTSSEVRAARLAAATATANPQGGSAPANPAVAAPGGPGSEVNTNLEKISDWLTTIIVGVGLTKLEDIPRGLETFGDRVAPYFGYGGKIFGIGGGLFFLVAGFFLAYVGTRVKLSLIFVWSQRTNQDLFAVSPQTVQIAGTAPPLPDVGSSAPSNEKVKEADRELLSKNRSDLKSPDEIVAWANAKARAGDFASALAAYKDVLSQVPPTETLQTNYATVLAASGDTAGANNVVATMTTSGLSADAQREARQRIAAAAQAGKVAAMRARLQEGLYKPAHERAYEDSIAAGEELLKLGDPGDPWAYVWLASAYGQRHAALSAKAEKTPEDEALLEASAARAVELVEQALGIEPKLKPTLQGLYHPAYRVGSDNDLDSLRPNARLDSLLLDKPAERETGGETPAADPDSPTPAATAIGADGTEGKT